jgi:peptidyl-prolyl cis-trans isomerase B (cyclophilin B)
MAEIATNYGNIVVKLYDSTPLHRDNFIRLVKAGFYDSLLFHRVIDSFMIQGGDPESKNAPDSVQLGAGEAPGGRIPAEFNKNYFHKKGALAAARDDNPEKASSNCQFYIVEGKPYNDTVLNMMECQMRNENPAFSFTDGQRKVYNTVGGAPFLDQNYTVFGEVVKGLDVVDKIAALPRDANDRPLQNVRMRIRMLN